MAQLVKNLFANSGDARDAGSIPGSGGSPGEGKWQCIPVFWPGESHGQRSLIGYSPRSCKRVGHDLVTKQQQPQKLILLTIVWDFSLLCFGISP